MKESSSIFKPFPEVVAALHRQGKNGILEFKDENTSYRIHFHKGSILAVEGGGIKDALSQRLLNSGKVAPWDLELAMEVAKESKKKKLGEVLIEMGLLKKEALISELNQKLKDTFTALFDLEKVQFNFYEEDVQPSLWTIIPTFTTADLILEGCRNMKNTLPITRMLRYPENYLSISSDAKMIYQKAKLNEKEKIILAFLKEARQIKEVISWLKGDTLESMKIIYGLIISGFLDLSKEKPKSLSPIPFPQEQASIPVTRGEVVEKFNKIGVGNYYEFLGINTEAKELQIEKTFQNLAYKFHPDHAVNESISDLKDKLEAIFLYLVKIRNTLLNPSSRKEYDKSIKEDDKKDSTLIKLSSAVTNYKYAMKMISEKKIQEAILSLLKAVENDPSNPLYPYKLGQLLKRYPEQQKEAELNFKRALELDPLNTDIMLELAQLYLKNNMQSKAEIFFKQALALDPLNPELQLKAVQFTKEIKLPLKEIAIFFFGFLLALIISNLFL